MQFIVQSSSDGTRLAGSDEGSGPAIVLVHGLLLARESWDAQALALARGARVVRVDLRGHGASAAPPGPYLMETLAGDLCDVLDARGIARATIVGHSLGGYVAFAFFRMFAERCAALGLVCTRAAEDDDATANFRYDLADRVERDGIAAAVDAFAARSLAPRTAIERPDLLAKLVAENERTNPRGAAAMLRGIAARAPSEDLFDEIRIPVRIVTGTQDAVIPMNFSEEMARGIAGAELDVLETGHVPLYEDPDAVTASLAALLETTRSATR
jgi:3-oxoadipate enol-lactonase